MPEAPIARPPGLPRGRREVLRLGLAMPLLGSGLLGCTPSPTLDEPGARPSAGRSSSAAPTPTPTPSPTVPATATAEQQLSAYAAAILVGPRRKDLDAPTRRLLGFLRDAHAEHATALAGADPTARPTSATPAPTAAPPALASASLNASLDRLARAESAQATAQRRAAVAATGLAALLSGSLAVSATTFAAALTADRPPGVVALGPHRAAPLLSDVEAGQAMVEQLHAVVYGYQVAIGRLEVGSGARARAVMALARARSLLDEQIAGLTKRRAEVPAAEAAYVPSPDPRSPADAAALIRALQTRLQPYAGMLPAAALIRALQTRLQPYAGMLLAAAGTEADRSRALSILLDTTRAARAWGAPLRAWPGWPD